MELLVLATRYCSLQLRGLSNRLENARRRFLSFWNLSRRITGLSLPIHGALFLLFLLIVHRAACGQISTVCHNSKARRLGLLRPDESIYLGAFTSNGVQGLQHVVWGADRNGAQAWLYQWRLRWWKAAGLIYRLAFCFSLVASALLVPGRCVLWGPTLSHVCHPSSKGTGRLLSLLPMLERRCCMADLLFSPGRRSASRGVHSAPSGFAERQPERALCSESPQDVHLSR